MFVLTNEQIEFCRVLSIISRYLQVNHEFTMYMFNRRIGQYSKNLFFFFFFFKCVEHVPVKKNKR